jgi:hypothetical protein
MRGGLIHLLQLLYFMLPAYLANMSPPFVRRWHGWNRPINVRLLDTTTPSSASRWECPSAYS